MGRKLREVMDSLPEKRQEKIARRREEMLEEIDTLQELRKRLGKPQAYMAARLRISQPAVSKMEHQADMTLSALRSYVGAMGGTVDVVINLPGHRPVKFESFKDIEEEDTDRRRV